MKNTIIVLILLLSIPVFAQHDAVKVNMLPVDFNITTPKLNSYTVAEKKHPGFIHTNTKPDYKRFLELYNKKQQAVKPTSRQLTFMDDPRVFSTVTAVESSSKPVSLYQQYSATLTEPSAALQLLGLAASITAGALSNGRYTGAPNPYYYSGKSRYLDSRAAIEAAYLQSTYRQQD